MSLSTGGLKDALKIVAVGEAGAHLGVWGSPEVVGGSSSQQASLSMTWCQTPESPLRVLSHPRQGRGAAEGTTARAIRP